MELTKEIKGGKQSILYILTNEDGFGFNRHRCKESKQTKAWLFVQLLAQIRSQIPGTKHPMEMFYPMDISFKFKNEVPPEKGEASMRSLWPKTA